MSQDAADYVALADKLKLKPERTLDAVYALDELLGYPSYKNFMDSHRLGLNDRFMPTVIREIVTTLLASDHAHALLKAFRIRKGLE